MFCLLRPGESSSTKTKGRTPGGRSRVLYLKRAPLVVLGVDPRPQGELCDEDLSRLGEQHRSLGADHLQ